MYYENSLEKNMKVCAIIYHPATSFYHIVVLKKPEQTVFSNFVRRGLYSVFTCQGMMSRSMYCKSLDGRLLEIAGIGFLIVAMARTMQC